MDPEAASVFVVLATFLGIAAGMLVTSWWGRRAARELRRIPRHWPLKPRRMASTAECLVWRWLQRVFFDQHVMIKIPVTRFTMPRGHANSAHWYQLLSGVYCTFTVCAPDGRVIGCVDVVGPNGISRSNRQLKLSLLSQCGIAYWVVQPDNLPGLAEIRMEFLGDDALAGSKDDDEARIALARQELREVLDRQRHQRPRGLTERKGAAARGPGAGHRHRQAESGFGSGEWQEANSFIAPLDSRRAELR